MVKHQQWIIKAKRGDRRGPDSTSQKSGPAPTKLSNGVLGLTDGIGWLVAATVAQFNSSI